MPKRTPPIEWYVAESDAEWQRLCARPTPDPAPAARRSLSVKGLPGVVALLLCLLAGAWWWPTDRAPWAAEATATAQPKPGIGALGSSSLPAGAGFEPEGGRAMSEWNRGSESAESFEYTLKNAQIVELQGGWGVARVVMYTEHGEPAYRQTRFYRRVGPDWRPAAPDAALWGAERSLATPSFVFHFRQRDAAVVVAVASQIEALYTTLRRNLGLPLTPSATKRVIEVSVTQTPGSVMPWSSAWKRIIVPSPAVYRAPLDLSDEELLAQSLALPLVASVSAQASQHYQLDSVWQPLVGGLYLWQLWALDLPLAVWHEEVVTWFYTDLPNSRPGQAIVLPDRYTALCAAHKLWMPAPAQINIPLLCMGVDWEDFYLSLWRWYDPLTHLNQLGAPSRPRDSLEESDSLPLAHPPGQTVALAILIEYMVATYGQERLPTLLAGLGQFDTWDTLLPAVFGLSPAEFEAGWRMYLAAHYGVPTRD